MSQVGFKKFKTSQGTISFKSCANTAKDEAYLQYFG
jgi:hypothetical protein